jgi:hypothetical protein
MAEQFFDHDIIHSRFEQPRGKGMAQIMEVEFMHPYPFNRFEPPMLEGVRILPPPEKPATGLGRSHRNAARARLLIGMAFATRLLELRPGDGASHNPSPRCTNHKRAISSDTDGVRP